MEYESDRQYHHRFCAAGSAYAAESAEGVFNYFNVTVEQVGYRMYSQNVKFGFFESIGRTDFPNGSFLEISKSIKMLYNSLDDNTVVFPGHGEKTLIAYEKNNNPFVRDI